jgi:hypothetical protein
MTSSSGLLECKLREMIENEKLYKRVDVFFPLDE